MARLAKIENGVVANVIVGDVSDFPDYVDVSNKRVGPGDTYDGSTFTEGDRVRYRTVLDSNEVKGLFTPGEIDAILDHIEDQNNGTRASVELRNTFRRLSNRTIIIDTQDPASGYANDIGLLHSLGLITTARRDELLKGKRL